MQSLELIQNILLDNFKETIHFEESLNLFNEIKLFVL